MTLPTYLDSGQPLEDRAADLVARMTLAEKVLLMAGSGEFTLPAIPRLGVPSLRMTDGPTGVRSVEGDAATVFPAAIALAATWDPACAQEVAAAVAREARALNDQVVLAPMVNMIRLPTGGRTFETYSEDPHLAAEMATAYVRGLQGEGVGASLKHFAMNNQERYRLRVSVEVDEAVLRETYLTAFERVVRDANPWTVMAAYNRLRGQHATQNPYLLNDILKGEWGYDGVVVSDWGATHATAEAANAGLDLEMPGPPRRFGGRLMAAVEAGEVSIERIEDAARRLARLIVRVGLLDGPPPEGELRTPRHRRIAREAAERAMVLLKNTGALLPLAAPTIATLAVIGPNARAFRLQGDGSSRVTTDRQPSLAQALSARLAAGVTILVEDGVDHEPFPPAARAAMFSPTQARTEDGLRRELLADPQRPPLHTRVDTKLLRWVSVAQSRSRPQPDNVVALRWRGWVWPERSGRHEFSVRGDGDCALQIGDDVLIGPQTEGQDDAYDPTGGVALRRTGVIELEAGRGYPIQVEYRWAPARPGDSFAAVSLGVREPTGDLETALAAARAADAVMLVVGSASSTESEAFDRADLALPGPQDALIEAVLAVCPRTVVVLNSGAPMAMPWIDRAPAVLQAWLPGEEGPEALARLLFGEASPSGRLPLTFPQCLEDTPAFAHPGDADLVTYGEGPRIGYRHYAAGGPKPLFAFGHGLTYGEAAYEAMETPATLAVTGAAEVRVTLHNAGPRACVETVQLYWRGPGSDRIGLAAFARVALAPGERRQAVLILDGRDCRAFDVAASRWTAPLGDWSLWAGASALDMKLEGAFSLVG